VLPTPDHSHPSSLRCRCRDALAYVKIGGGCPPTSKLLGLGGRQVVCRWECDLQGPALSLRARESASCQRRPNIDPAAERFVAGDDQAGPFVACGDELEEQVRGLPGPPAPPIEQLAAPAGPFEQPSQRRGRSTSRPLAAAPVDQPSPAAAPVDQPSHPRSSLNSLPSSSAVVLRPGLVAACSEGSPAVSREYLSRSRG